MVLLGKCVRLFVVAGALEKAWSTFLCSEVKMRPASVLLWDFKSSLKHWGFTDYTLTNLPPLKCSSSNVSKKEIIVSIYSRHVASNAYDFLSCVYFVLNSLMTSDQYVWIDCKERGVVNSVQNLSVKRHDQYKVSFLSSVILTAKFTFILFIFLLKDKKKTEICELLNIVLQKSVFTLSNKLNIIDASILIFHNSLFFLNKIQKNDMSISTM